MNCRAAERLIYLGRELTEHESLELQEHIAGCASCASLQMSYADIELRVSELSRREESPIDASRLTEKIITKINDRRKPVVSTALFPGTWIRLGLSGISIMLILSFYFEFSRSPDFSPVHSSGNTLVTHSVGSNILKQRDRKQASLIAVAEARKEMYITSNNDSNETD